jgi:tRNA-specific 2-thiouridylase
MEICFVGKGDYRDFLRRTAPAAWSPGPVVDTSGARIGAHEGILGFTVGQRRGLGVAVGEPRYVVGIEPATSTVVIGSDEELDVARLSLTGLTTTGADLAGPVLAQYRAHGGAVPATLHGSVLCFDRPQRSVAPGQTVAFYHGDRVLGGAIIESTNPGG